MVDNRRYDHVDSCFITVCLFICLQHCGGPYQWNLVCLQWLYMVSDHNLDKLWVIETLLNIDTLNSVMVMSWTIIDWIKIYISWTCFILTRRDILSIFDTCMPMSTEMAFHSRYYALNTNADHLVSLQTIMYGFQLNRPIPSILSSVSPDSVMHNHHTCI
jgi:hypothetical protein